ncbi:hypothetical protein RFI_10481 [Reticulomyxa filosa]|uniref:Vacuolar protein-sorting-associated protein 25 n=1 Tax=Reticulomyxa filosa TaxID=46433 RepID=X6NKX5_RETFI|nr:hypothetical protein RFI_10481 [Reticulomyxa filosa]|eukprot:ETO26651.1 hypothetical protein RFI_10481 [Reticulomyxa filosa]
MSKHSKTEYSLPDYYHYPPLFTIQKVAKTRESQLQVWTDLIINFLEHNHKTSIYVEKEINSPPFCNSKLNRKLKLSDMRLILDHMQKNGYGNWDDDEKTVFSCSWKKLETWATSIYQWATKEGQIGKILTLYDLHSGDAASHTDFHGIDAKLLLKVLDVLEGQGKARVYKDGDVVDEYGVRFFDGTSKQ